MGVCICDIIILNRGIKYHMTTATEVGLLQAIISEPAANDLRLIYADWLEENGQPERAEFIRVQIELASMDWDYERDERDDRKYAHYAALRGRERELLSTMLDTSSNGRRASTMAGYLWAKEVLGRHVAVWPHTFRRGFVAEVICTITDWMGWEYSACRGQERVSIPCRFCLGTPTAGGGHGPTIVRAAPIERVTIRDALYPCYSVLSRYLPPDNPIISEQDSSTALIAWARQQIHEHPRRKTHRSRA